MQPVALWWKSRLHPKARPMLRMSLAATTWPRGVRPGNPGHPCLGRCSREALGIGLLRAHLLHTRQHCGGVCREELGGPWVAFFLSGLGY
jgi:hypothetical protein